MAQADRSKPPSLHDILFQTKLDQFQTEVVEEVTAETGPQEVLTILSALSTIAHKYADPWPGDSVDPNVVQRLGDMAADAFARFSGLDHLSDDKLEAVKNDGSDLAQRYLFPNRNSDEAGR